MTVPDTYYAQQRRRWAKPVIDQRYAVLLRLDNFYLHLKSSAHLSRAELLHWSHVRAELERMELARWEEFRKKDQP